MVRASAGSSPLWSNCGQGGLGLWFALVRRSWCGVWVPCGEDPAHQGGGRAGRLPLTCWFHGRVGGEKVLVEMTALLPARRTGQFDSLGFRGFSVTGGRRGYRPAPGLATGSGSLFVNYCQSCIVASMMSLRPGQTF